jgi:hypothetical protein
MVVIDLHASVDSNESERYVHFRLSITSRRIGDQLRGRWNKRVSSRSGLVVQVWRGQAN